MAFSKFYRRCCDLISRFPFGLESLLRQGLSEPDFCGDLVCGLGRIVALVVFRRSSLRWFLIVERLAVALVYCDGLHAWWSGQFHLAALLSSLVACRWVGL